MNPIQKWIMGGSVARIGGLGVGVGAGVLAASLGFRQYHLQNSPIVEAAKSQLQSADAVRHLLGSDIASTSGFVGGYTDPVQGTAAITLQVMSQGGVRAIARVEAEAEWVQLQAEAQQRGEEPPTPAKAGNCRWLLRHLEVELLDSAVASGAAGEHSLTLYSLPSRIELSPWAPSREPSRLPHWLRALLPEPSGVTQSEAFPRVALVAGASILMHFVVFMRLHRRLVTEKALRRAEELLALPETPTLKALYARAIELAQQAKVDRAAVVQQAGAVLYGKATDTVVIGYTALSDSRELFFKAEKLGTKSPSGKIGGGRRNDDWVITHVAVEDTTLYSGRLAKLPNTANAEEMLAVLASSPAQPLDLGILDRRVSPPRR